MNLDSQHLSMQCMLIILIETKEHHNSPIFLSYSMIMRNSQMMVAVPCRDDHLGLARESIKALPGWSCPFVRGYGYVLTLLQFLLYLYFQFFFLLP